MSCYIIKQCAYCRSMQHSTKDCASQGDLINFEEELLVPCPLKPEKTEPMLVTSDMTISEVEDHPAFATTTNKHTSRSSISSTEANVSTDEDRAYISSELTTKSGVAADFEDKWFVKDFEKAVALSLKDQVASSPTPPDDTAKSPVKILRLVLDKPKGSTAVKKQKQPEACLAVNTEVPSLSAVPLELMVPLTEQRAATKLPDSSFLALSEGGTKRKKDRNPPKRVTGPVVRTFNDQNNTVRVSEIREKRNGGPSGHSYFDITPELYYLR